MKNNNKKRRWIPLIILLFVMLITANIAVAEEAPSFGIAQNIWKAITGLQIQVNKNAPYHLYDANGQDLGIIMSTDLYSLGKLPHYVTYIPDLDIMHEFQIYIDNKEIKLSFDRSLKDVKVYFEDLNCVGNAFTSNGNSPRLQPYALGAIKGGRFFQAKSFDALTLTSQSYYDNLELVCKNNEVPQIHDIAFPLEEIELSFNLPVSFPLEVRQK